MNKKFAIILKGEIRTNIFLFEVSMVNSDLSHSAQVGSVVINLNLLPDGKGCNCLPSELDDCREVIIKECVEMANALKQVIDASN